MQPFNTPPIYGGSLGAQRTCCPPPPTTVLHTLGPRKPGFFRPGGATAVGALWPSLVHGRAFFLPTGFRVLSPIHWCLQCPQACSRGPHSIKKGCHTLPGPSQYWFTPVFPLLFPFRRQILRRSARYLEPSGHAALPRSLLYCIDLVVRKGFLFYTVLAGFYIIHQPVATHGSP